MYKKIFITFLFTFCICSLAFSQQESLTITTYYPSPYGVYKELTTDDLTVNDKTETQRLSINGARTDLIGVDGANFHWIRVGGDNDGNCALGFVPGSHAILRWDFRVDGNVGLGINPNPAYRLYVQGNMYVNGDITTDSTTYPDYVFEPGYTLLPLGELKNFIVQKKHLPNMPSAQEIKENGVKVFEQNRLMLEKLEEAYLYIIELEERIAKLENALNSKLNAGQ